MRTGDAGLQLRAHALITASLSLSACCLHHPGHKVLCSAAGLEQPSELGMTLPEKPLLIQESQAALTA